METYMCCNCEKVFVSQPIILIEYDNALACSKECADEFEEKQNDKQLPFVPP